jgi:hypothetical protein
VPDPDFLLDEIITFSPEMEELLFELNQRLRKYDDLHRDVKTEGLNVYVGPNGFAEQGSGTNISNYLSVSTQTGNYTVTDNDGVHVLWMTNSSAATITLPTLADNLDREIIVMRRNAAVTIDGEGAETINGAATASVASQYDTLRLLAGPTEWGVT